MVPATPMRCAPRTMLSRWMIDMGQITRIINIRLDLPHFCVCAWCCTNSRIPGNQCTRKVGPVKTNGKKMAYPHNIKPTETWLVRQGHAAKNQQPEYICETSPLCRTGRLGHSTLQQQRDNHGSWLCWWGQDNPTAGHHRVRCLRQLVLVVHGGSAERGLEDEGH